MFFFNLFKPISSVHGYSKRQLLNGNLFIKSARSRYLHYNDSNLWNLLPITISSAQITPFSKFRKTIKTFIDGYNNITSC